MSRKSDLIILVLLAVGVVSTIAMLVLPHLAGSHRSPVIETQIRLDQMASASRQYFKVYGSWPKGIVDFYPTGNPQHVLFIANVSAATNDPWNHPLHYEPFDEAVGYGKVVSLGRDGKLGGVGLDSDIEVRF